MTHTPITRSRGTRRRTTRRWWSVSGVIVTVAGTAVMAVSTGGVAQAAVALDLGTAAPFSVLAGSAVTNTGPSVLDGDVGVSPGTAITGFPPGVSLGAPHAKDAVATQAQSDALNAYNDAAGQASDGDTGTELGGQRLTPGVYTADSSLGLTGTVTLDAEGDENAVFIFQVGSALTTASSSSVSLVGGATACNVFWQIGESATLGTGSTFVGTIVADQSVSLTTRATVQGRAIALNGAVTLDSNVFTAPDCEDDGEVTVTATSDTATSDTATSDTATSDTATSDTATSDTGTSDTATSSTGTGTGTTEAGSGTGTGTSTGDLITSTQTSTTTAIVTSWTPGTPGGPGGPTSPYSGPPLAYTGSSSATVPALGGGLVLLTLGGLLVWRGRTRTGRHTS